MCRFKDFIDKPFLAFPGHFRHSVFQENGSRKSMLADAETKRILLSMLGIL